MDEKQKEAARKKSLGELGELFAIKALVDAEYDRIRNLNDDHMNVPFADIYCEKGDSRLVISVKARNKFRKDGKLNSRYNLGTNAYDKARQTAEKSENVVEKREEMMAMGMDTTPMVRPNPHVQFFFVKNPAGVNIQFM